MLPNLMILRYWFPGSKRVTILQLVVDFTSCDYRTKACHDVWFYGNSQTLGMKMFNVYWQKQNRRIIKDLSSI